MLEYREKYKEYTEVILMKYLFDEVVEEIEYLTSNNK